MKNYILDDGKVRFCTSNIAKMNIFEWIRYSGRLKVSLLGTLGQFKEGIVLIGAGLINMFLIIFFPITLSIVAYFEIKKAKEEIKNKE